MKAYREELSFNVPTRRALVNITPQVNKALKKSGIREGLCLVNPTAHLHQAGGQGNDSPNEGAGRAWG